MDKRRLLRRISAGQFNNVRYKDLVTLIEALGFQYYRTRGSHQIFKHVKTSAEINLQPDGGQAKPWQVKLLVHEIEKYGLRLEE